MIPKILRHSLAIHDAKWDNFSIANPNLRHGYIHDAKWDFLIESAFRLKFLFNLGSTCSIQSSTELSCASHASRCVTRRTPRQSVNAMQVWQSNECGATAGNSIIIL